MYLKRLEIQGFKSFAVKTTMEFSSGIIAIVGPNGSGKSNVADSLRWVLGEQSAKIIRGKKADDVIFAGSEKKTRLGFCEIVATFDNSDRRIPLDAPEVSIGRRIDRTGNSEYLINGQPVRLLDIIDLVLKSNIGTSRYTVIGQGTIDQMILAGPQETKSLLDEASGVKAYYIKRERTLRRLEQTAQNLMRAEDLVAEIAPRLRSLRRQAKRMEERFGIEQELKIYQREYFGKTFWTLKLIVDKFIRDLEIQENSKSKIEENIRDLQRSAETKETTKTGFYGKFKQIQIELTSLQTQKNSLLEDLSLVRGKMQSQKTQSNIDPSTLQLRAHEIDSKLQEVENKIKEVLIQDKDNGVKLSEANKKLKELNDKMEKLYEFLHNPNQIDWEGLNRELGVLENSINDFYFRVESSQPWETVKPSIDSLRKNFIKFKEFVSKSLHDPMAVSNLQTELKQLLKAKEVLNVEIQDFELELSKNKITLEFLQKEKQKLTQENLQISLEFKKSNSQSMDDFLKDLFKEEEKINAEVEVISKEISKLEELFKTQEAEAVKEQSALHELESSLRKKQEELLGCKDRISALLVEKTKSDTQMEVLKEEVVRILGHEDFNSLTEKPVNSNTPSLEEKILKLKTQLENIGGMDELTMKEYEETESRYQNLGNQIQDLKKGMSDLKTIIDELDGQIKVKFNEAFHKINEKFEHYFRILFNGGRAHLNLVKAQEENENSETGIENSDLEMNTDENLRPEEKILKKYEKGTNNIIGVDIKATPPGKKLSSIQALSGGERSLTSIALLCSLLTCFPSPFVVLDEVDAALDDANTIRFAQILNGLATSTQFITITHNRETMAHANMLYGVTMGDDGVSKLLSVKLEQAKAYAK